LLEKKDVLAGVLIFPESESSGEGIFVGAKATVIG
jgi:hypothetical protein